MASGEWGRSESKNYAIQPGISILCTNQQNRGRTRLGSPSLRSMPDRDTLVLDAAAYYPFASASARRNSSRSGKSGFFLVSLSNCCRANAVCPLFAYASPR
jgi:hypothetical protein